LVEEQKITMDRIDKIILESINDFLINEVDEARSKFVSPYQTIVDGEMDKNQRRT
jgi:hypothetical protein